MSTIVVFNKDGSVRINEGANEADFKGQDYLVNPIIPRGIPPHQWKKHPDGYIAGTPATVKKKDFTTLKYIATCLLGVVIGYLIHRG